jgi:hypothetical protein
MEAQMRGFKSALVAVSALLLSGSAVLAQSRFNELQRTFDEQDRTLECCTQRWAQLDSTMPEGAVAPNDIQDEGEE